MLIVWAETGGEGAKFWMSVLTDIKNRGVKDMFFLVCDGLKPLPDVVSERVAAHDGPDLHNPFDLRTHSGWRRRKTGTHSNTT